MGEETTSNDTVTYTVSSDLSDVVDVLEDISGDISDLRSEFQKIDDGFTVVSSGQIIMSCFLGVVVGCLLVLIFKK